MTLLLDKIIIVLLCFFFLSGLLRGFLKSLLGPFAFVFCLVSGIVFYDVNRNIFMSIFIIIIGTVLLTIALNILLSIGITQMNKESRGKVFIVSRILGSITNLFWQGNILFILILLISALPLTNEKINFLISQIPESKMLRLYDEKVVSRDDRFQAFAASVATRRDPIQYQAALNSKQFIHFQKNEKFQKFINDPQIIAAAKAKNDFKILTSSALRDLVTDDPAMYAMTDLIEMIYKKNLAALQKPSAQNPNP